MDILYEADIRDGLPRDAFAARSESGWVVPGANDDDLEDGLAPEDEIVEYARALVEGVQDHQADIDMLIVRYADRWAIDRMPVVDRSVLRIAIYELLHRTDIPTPVAINEAVDLAKSLSTEDSGRFVNGILGRIAELRDASPTG